MSKKHSTKEKTEEVADSLVKRGELASGDRFKMVDKLLKERSDKSLLPRQGGRLETAQKQSTACTYYTR